MASFEDEWDICNDYGFIHKRRKRQQQQQQVSTLPDTSSSSVHFETDLKQWKKIGLSKLKTRYQKELSHWELLSNGLKTMEENAQLPQQTQSLEPSEPDTQMGNSSFHSQLDELLLQVEAQEAVINDVLKLCDAVEVMCEEEEERVKQPFFDLPVWGSPRTLMEALTEDFHDSVDDL
ncbi:hypothetical protein IFM89_034586 [Coptis chinensis]|uniref:Uncharacterized protein n=1 Tax=Coptis chinensis TaxID=261450 RepID=A0A835HU40_9MAGN|nr:hypothetical protein IFM89_034586 [Coptis chinensis]